MDMHRERTEVVLCGGKPWGFSIKGGTENNKSIVVSKLERGGKGEASGLKIGDIIICVNEVNLVGMRRTQAVELIRKSGDRLILSVERSFPLNSNAMPGSVQSPPYGGYGNYNSDPPLQPTTQAKSPSITDQKNLSNNDGSPSRTQGSNSTSNLKPAGYIFPTNNKQLQQKQIKETIKSVVIDPKRDALMNSQPDIIRSRFADKNRKSVPTSMPVPRNNESPGDQQNSVAMRHRYDNNKDTERPRSWHASKHPEIEQGMLSSVEKSHPPPFARRKSKEWLESEDLRSTLDRKSSESLLLTSSTEQLSSANTANGDSSQNFHGVNVRVARDRTSINSNPSLMEAVEALARSRPGSIDYDSHSNLEQSHHSAADRSSQDSLDSTSHSVKSHCPSSDSKINIRFEGSVGNRLRSSGRYGEIWNLPQAHRRAKSFDALSEDSPKQNSSTKSGAGRKSLGSSQKSLGPSQKSLGSSQKSLGSSQSDLPTRKSDSTSPKPLSPAKHTSEHSRFCIRTEKGKHIDALISNFERASPVGHVFTNSNVNKMNNSNITSPINDGRHPSESKSILKRLQNQHLSSSSNINSKKPPEGVAEKEQSSSPPGSTNKLHVQSSGGLIGLYTGKDPDYATLQSRSDEYKKNIQGMSKKVLRVTSFTRKDLELSPPYQSPVHQPKSFCYPLISESETEPPPLTGNGPVRSKSTSSLLDTVTSVAVTSMVAIPITREETKKEFCSSLSPVPPTVCHVTATEKFKDPVPVVAVAEVIKNVREPDVKRLSGIKDDELNKSKDNHCANTYHGEQPPPDIINHTNIVIQSPPPPQPNRPHTEEIPPKPRTPPKVSVVSSAQPPISPEPVITSPTVTTVLTSPPALPLKVATPLPFPNVVPSAHTVITTTSSVTPFSDILASSSPLPSTYYQTTVSKAIIINRLQEKVEGGEIVSLDDENETKEERNMKKIELLKRITKNLNDLHKFKETIKLDFDENEQLGKTVKQCVEKLCTSRELERYNTFVEEIDKIVNLIFSITGRLARVENTLATLAEDADPEERNGLVEKKRKLSSQLEEANSLKENVNRRQQNVCTILSSYMSPEQYGDFEHYIKTKTALISEQRDIDDKMKLGEEQMRELYDSLPEDLQDEYPQYQSFLPSALSSSSDDRQGPS